MTIPVSASSRDATREALAQFFQHATNHSVSHWYTVLGCGKSTLSDLSDISPIILGGLLLTAGLINLSTVKNTDGTTGERIVVKELEWKEFMEQYGFTNDELEIAPSRFTVPHSDPNRAKQGITEKRNWYALRIGKPNEDKKQMQGSMNWSTQKKKNVPKPKVSLTLPDL